MNYNKNIYKLFASLIIIIILFFFFEQNLESYCSGRENVCFDNMIDGVIKPIYYVLFSLLLSLTAVLVVSNKLKKSGLIFILITIIPFVIFIFSQPINCASVMPCSRIEASVTFMSIHFILTIITLSITAIYFHSQKSKKIPEKAGEGEV